MMSLYIACPLSYTLYAELVVDALLVFISCSDVERGSLCYQTPHYESSVVSSYIPVPLSGASGAAQVSTVNGAGALYERTSVVAVWRALDSTAGSNIKKGSSVVAVGDSKTAHVEQD